jgi:DNA-binding NtrC family response regulator
MNADLVLSAAMSSEPNEAPILLVDDEPQMLLSLSMTLETSGLSDVQTCEDGTRALELLDQRQHAAVLLDMLMPKISGMELLPRIVEQHPEVPVVMLTAVNELETAVECMKLGAFDYLVKPVDDARLVTTVRRALEMHRMRGENARLRRYLLTDELEHPEAFEPIITCDRAMHALFQYAEAISASTLPVLISGETGTGKELFARAVHEVSGRAGAFVAVNVAGLDDTFFADALFGHLRGAYTGADRQRAGLVEQAAGGTLFLDEIGDLSPESQTKLLRLLQEGTYYPLGADEPSSSDARIVVATLKDLDELQRRGQYRQDLFYRLKTHQLRLPPLRQRGNDLPALVDHLLDKAARRLDKAAPTPPRELVTLLGTYPFPGNVRELESMIYDAVSTHRGGVLSMESFRAEIAQQQQVPVETAGAGAEVVLPEQLPTLKQIEQLLIDEALLRADGNQSIAAEMLGLSRRALNNRLRRSEG